MKLHEIKADPLEAVVESFLQECADETAYSIVGSRVNFHGDVIYHGRRFKTGVPPFKFGEVHGDLLLRDAGLTELGDWCPTSVSGSFDVSENQIKTIEALPTIASCQRYMFDGCPITSLKDIHKKIPRATLISLASCPLESHVLGLCLIKGLWTLGNISSANGRLSKYDDDIYTDENGDAFNETETALNIVHNYLGKGRSGLLAAQQELLDLNLDDFAQL